MASIPLSPPSHNVERDGFTSGAADMNQLILELTGILEGAGTPEEFFTPFLERVLETTGSVGVAVWQRQPGGSFQLLKELNFGAANLENVPGGMMCHSLLLEEAALSRRGQWVSPSLPEQTGKLLKANLSKLAMILAPILVEDKTVGLLEVFLSPDVERTAKRGLIRLTTELAGFAAAFLHKRQWKQMQDQQQVWQHLEAFAAKVHESLNPREVAYLAANDGKRLLECDQLAVARCSGRSCDVLAVSGAVTLEARSPLVKAMQALLKAVAHWGEALAFQGTRDDTLPPDVLQCLDDYLAQSNSRLLIAQPIVDARLEGPSQVVGVLLAETFGPGQELPQLSQRMEFVARHVGPALSNALAMDRLPLKWLTRPLAHVQMGLGTKSRWRLAAFAVLLAGLTAFLAFYPLALRPEATGQLVPQERRIVYATVNGKILQLAAKHGDHVEKGQELLFIEDLDTQLKVDQLAVKIGSLGQKLSAVEEQLNKPLSPRERADYLNERIRVQYELGKAKVERNLLLADNRSPRKAPIAAPVAGQVLTFDAREKLLGKTVKIGEPLLRLAETDGPWEIELFIPEREATLLRQTLTRSGGADLDVDVLVSNDPQRVYKGKLSGGALGGETTIRNDKVVLPARVAIADRGLLGQLERMPVGVEVHARIHCGHAAAGYVWFNEIWTFLYEKFIF